MNKIFPVLITTLLLILSVNAFSQDASTLVEEGQKAPDFEYTTLAGENIKLSDLEGKVVWLNFFATWCPPCRKELPYLEKALNEKLGQHNDFVLLVIGREHTAEELQKFKLDHKLNLPFVPDPDRTIFSKYANQNIPRNFIIDRNGKIAVASTGFKEEEFSEIVGKVLLMLNQR